MKYIPLDKCRNGYLYRIEARNAGVGIYNEKEKSFTINRLKGDRFLYPEYHWDTGEPYGTVKPLEEFEEAPGFKDKSNRVVSGQNKGARDGRLVSSYAPFVDVSGEVTLEGYG